MYYGDSQIEGDRMTSYLRQALRTGHGGTGPGLAAASDAGYVHKISMGEILCKLEKVQLSVLQIR